MGGQQVCIWSGGKHEPQIFLRIKWHNKFPLDSIKYFGEAVRVEQVSPFKYFMSDFPPNHDWWCQWKNLMLYRWTSNILSPVYSGCDVLRRFSHSLHAQQLVHCIKRCWIQNKVVVDEILCINLEVRKTNFSPLPTLIRFQFLWKYEGKFSTTFAMNMQCRVSLPSPCCALCFKINVSQL